MQKDYFLQNLVSFSVFGGLKARTRSICDVSKQLDWLRIAAHVLQGALQAWEVSPWFTQMSGLGMAGNGWKIHTVVYTKLSDVPLPVGGLRLAGGCWLLVSQCIWYASNCATPTKPTVSWKNAGLNWARGKSWMKWGTVAMDCHIPTLQGILCCPKHLSSHRWQACPLSVNSEFQIMVVGSFQ